MINLRGMRHGTTNTIPQICWGIVKCEISRSAFKLDSSEVARDVHDLCFEPKYEEFRPRTIWSLSNAFTSAFKELDPIPQFKATAKLGEFLEARFSPAMPFMTQTTYGLN